MGKAQADGLGELRARNHMRKSGGGRPGTTPSSGLARCSACRGGRQRCQEAISPIQAITSEGAREDLEVRGGWVARRGATGKIS